MKIDLIAASVKRESVKCQKNDFDSLTVADGRTRPKKQGNTWFFQKSPYYSSVNCQSVNDCQNGGLTVNCKQIRHFRATVKLSRRSADKKVKKSSNKWECQSVKECQEEIWQKKSRKYREFYKLSNCHRGYKKRIFYKFIYF